MFKIRRVSWWSNHHPELPPNAQQMMINGFLYYQADGAYFQPAMQNGVTVYVTARP
jgi:hypothetical protein